ncbi:MAG TPA: hypothetical protein VGQ62_03965 [Chloroflexota bacterium]|nr:hypothetical protein [Chloroflexota bacterium]
MTQDGSIDLQATVDTMLTQLTDGLAPDAAALALAVLANRTVGRLHALSRAEATAHKDQPTWPLWAQLQNASRNLVLQASTCRDLAARLAGRRQ